MTITIEKIKSLFNFSGSDRSAKTKKNIILLFLIHGVNFFALLLIVPLTLNYLGPEEYGIWMTLSSILVWVTYLDLGIGNGLRVKLAESLAHEDFTKAKIYVSTSYAIFSSGIFSLFILFLIINPFLDWSVLLNTSKSLKYELNSIVIWVLGLFLFQFVLKLITYVISADQRTSITGALNLLVNILTVFFLFILTKTGSSGSLFYASVGVSAVPVVVFLAANYLFFRSLFKKISPSFKYINLNYSKDLIVLGGQFFVIQAAGLVVFASQNMIITQIFSPSEVTVYNIAFRYFNFVSMFFGIFLNPLLPAYTEAYAKNDLGWIKKATNKIIKIWFILSAGVVVMIISSGIVYKLWVGSSVHIPFGLSVAMGIFIIITNWCNIYSYIQNGLGKIRIQFYNAIFIAIISIPLSIFLAKTVEMGIAGVIVAPSLCFLAGAVVGPVQYRKILNRQDFGIWGK